jgi:hypothetical protein
MGLLKMDRDGLIERGMDRHWMDETCSVAAAGQNNKGYIELVRK